MLQEGHPEHSLWKNTDTGEAKSDPSSHFQWFIAGGDQIGELPQVNVDDFFAYLAEYNFRSK